MGNRFKTWCSKVVAGMAVVVFVLTIVEAKGSTQMEKIATTLAAALLMLFAIYLKEE